jgi:hypothetical protein
MGLLVGTCFVALFALAFHAARRERQKDKFGGVGYSSAGGGESGSGCIDGGGGGACGGGGGGGE